MTDDRIRALWAVTRNALAWGTAWAVIGGAIAGLLSLVFPGSGIDSIGGRVTHALMAAVSLGLRFGIAGGVIGAAFAAMVRFGYRGRRLADINPFRFALLGAVAGGVGVPLYLQLMNVLFGDGPIAWGLVLDDSVWATVFGGVVAAGTIFLARRADALAHRHERAALAGGDETTVPAAGPEADKVVTPRSR